jgi:hypothetical protein
LPFALERRTISRMTLIELLVILILIGVGLYLVNSLIPMDAKIKTIINVVVIVVVLLWLLEVFGLIGGAPLHLNSRLRGERPVAHLDSTA